MIVLMRSCASSKSAMVKVDLKGIVRIQTKGRIYFYAWRGGPRLRGQPGSPEFLNSYQEALASRIPADDGRVARLVSLYKQSDAYSSLASSTRKEWTPWLDRIAIHFGDLRVGVFDNPQSRRIILQWRSRFSDRPRTADMGMQVLSRLLAHAVEIGKIGTNPCAGIKRLYSASRADIVWTDADIERLKAATSIEVAHAVDLASHTGLRLGDLLRLSWSHVGADAIMIKTGKSGRRREAVIPLYDALRAVLAAIPKRATTVLTTSRGRPWSRDGFGSSFNKAKIRAGTADADLHFHDLRGTAATRFYTSGLSERVIAEIMGWEEAHVARIIRRYVDRSAATRAIIAQLNRNTTDT